MSAIAGIVRFNNAPVDRADFQRMQQVLESRGGDNFRSLAGPSFACAFAGFHFTPEDLHDRQPISLPDGSYFLFCGRLDNRPDMIRDLGIRASEAGHLSDSAIAARAWLRWSTGGLRRWIGPHASLVWKPDEQKLIMLRGAPSGRALIYHQSGDTIYFSTTLDALFALPQIPREFDEHVLADVLLSAPSGSDFLYRGMESIPTSHWVELSPSGRTDHRYWRLERGSLLKFKREEECWEAFEELFSTVVRQYLRRTGKVGIRLSGGLDSSLLAAFCCRELAAAGQILHGYTRIPRRDADVPVTLGGCYLDESAKVRDLAALHMNLKTNFIAPDDRSILDGLEDWFGANYSPANITPTYQTGYRPLMEQAKDDGVKLLLNAGCGNFTFSYTGLGRLQELFRSGRWLRLHREIKHLKIRGYKPKRLFIQEVIKPSLPDWYHHLRIRQKSRQRPTWDEFSSLNPIFARKTGADLRLREHQNARAYWECWSSWKQRSHPFHHGRQVAQGGGGDSLYGFDQRDPSGDRRLVEFCLALPERFYLHNGVNRRLVRAGMRHLLPASILDEYKLGLQDADWFARVEINREDIEACFEKFRNDPDVSAMFDMDKIETMWSEFESTDWRTAPYRKAVRMQLALLGPLHAGNFVRWFYGKND